MTREYTYQDLFEGEKFALDSALRDGVDYEAFQRLRMLLLLSHNQINKLEARIAELESRTTPRVEVSGLVQEAFNQGTLRPEDWPHYVLRGDGTIPQHVLTNCEDPKCLWCNQSREETRLAKLKESVVVGYVPDDFR